MKKWLSLILMLLLLSPAARAQLGGFGDVDITSDNTSFSNGLAIGQGNVVIHYGTSTIYCDYAQYNADTRDALVKGNVRIYSDGHIFVGERAVYNFETKQLRALDFHGDFYPFKFASESFSSLGPNAYEADNAVMTTSDSSKPDYYMKARTVRVYAHDRVVFSDVTLYLGKTPIFWFPYLYQSLNRDSGFTIRPGYDSLWGAFLLSEYSFPVSENVNGKFHLDLRSLRGAAAGLDLDYKYGKNNESWGKFVSYFANDQDTQKNDTSYARAPIDSSRYRISLQGRSYITDDIYATININKLSDSLFLQDFVPSLFRLDPEPDNMIALTKWDENYTVTAITRVQLNDFYQTTERLPDVAWDIKRQQLFNTPLFYEGEVSAAALNRNFEDGSTFSDYNTGRLDAFFQFLYPKTYFGWLNFTPRVGVRGTYYSSSGNSTGTIFDNNTGLTPLYPTTTTTPYDYVAKQGAVFRPVFTAGFESSFKLTKDFDEVQTRKWGFDGLRHVLQPYTDFSYVYTGKNPDDILQFDRENPSTQLAPHDLSAFNSIDAITDWTIWRFGARNRLETRRDNETVSWLETDSYLDINLQEPEFPGLTYRQGTFSNLFNNIKWTPLPWLTAQVDSQVPLSSKGFTEINTNVDFVVSPNFRFNLGHRYIQNNPYFDDSSLITFTSYFRLNENWGLSVNEQYEMHDHVLEYQSYQIHRDLSSWTAALGFLVRDNKVNGAGSIEYGVMLTFTLKDFPSINAPISFDPGSLGGK